MTFLALWTMPLTFLASVVGAQSRAARASGESVFDLAIVNGRVIDPETGLDGIRAVGIRDGRIAAISASTLRGRTTIETPP